MEHIYQHFRAYEQQWIDECYDLIQQVEDQYVPKLTPFLNPRERSILQSICNQQEIACSSYGGFEEAENQRVLIYPSYHEVIQDDFSIQLFQLRYATKFVTLTHREVLGGLMAIGLERATFGDILIVDEVIQFAATAETADFIAMQFTEVGKANVRAEQIEQTQLKRIEHYEERLLFVSSLRLDTLLSEILHISRQRASKLIESEKVKLNWTVYTQKSEVVEVGDQLSIRGFGRFQILRIEGTTKKDNIRCVIGQLK